MARVKIDLPEKYSFSTKMQIRIGDLSGGVHLGNHILVSFLNEAMMSMFRENGFPELHIEGYAFINADLAVSYKSEAFHWDILKIDIAIGDVYKYGCDILFHVINEETGKETASAKMGMLFINYETKELAKIPEKFKKVFNIG